MRRTVAVLLFLIPGCHLGSDCGEVTCHWVIHGDLRLPVQETWTRQAALRVGETIDVSAEAIAGCFDRLGEACVATSETTWTSSDPAVASVTPVESANGLARAVVAARGVGVAVISARVVGGKRADGKTPLRGDAEILTITVTA